MNISKREKTLIITLGIVVFVVLFVKFYLMAELNKISSLKGQISEYSQNYDLNLVYKQKVEGMDSNLKIINQKLKDLRAEFPPRINCDEILMMVTKMGKDSGVEISSISLEDASEVDTSTMGAEKTEDTSKTPETQNAAGTQNSGGTVDNGAVAVSGITDNRLLAALKNLGLADLGLDRQSTDAAKKVNIPDGKAYVFSIKISAKGTNQKIKDFFSKVAELKNKAQLNNISLSNEKDGNINLTASLDFYGIMDKNAGLYTLLGDGSWVPLESARRNNIFGTYEGYTGAVGGSNTTADTSVEGNTDKTGTAINTGSYDFSMAASAFGGSLAPPSVSIFCKGVDINTVNDGMPLLYGDNKGVESIQLYVEEKNGSFYCKYKTQHGQFPEKEYDKMAEFVPVGDSIKMIIASSKRVDQQDKAGVKLVITNKTSKKFLVDVLYDNQTNPRVSIEQVGDVKIDYKKNDN